MNLFKLTLITTLVISQASLASVLQKVGDFTLLDHQGVSHQLSWYGDQKAIAILIHANGDADVRSAVQSFTEIREAFKNEQVTFFLLNPLTQDNRQNIAAEAIELGINFPVLVDETQLVAESLGVDKTAEVFLINPNKMTIIFRGPVGENFKQALSTMVADQDQNTITPSVEPLLGGSKISFPARELHHKQAVSYTADIVPILQNNCVSCHHDGGIGPWSMSSHAMVQGWSVMMQEVVMTQRMPPGQIDPHVGKTFQETTALTAAEQQTLMHWIEAGAPMDKDAVDPLSALKFIDPKFTLGEPDMIFKVPAQSIPATGVLEYRFIPVKLDLDEDVWVRAVEFVPGDRKVLHHVIAYLASPADKSVRGRQNGSARGESIGGFAPGRQPDEFRDDSGRLISKGSNLLLQMHYTTSGKATIDETEIGLYLHKKTPKYVMAGGVAGQRRFFIPAHAKDHKLQGEQLIERDAYLYGMTPHMHFRGKYMSYTAEYPDGTSEILLSVPKYNFNWQFSYRLQEPLFLPAGTKLVARGAMDNSDRNPFNPDPSKPVHFGLQTKHEMFFGFTTLRYVGDTPYSEKDLAAN